jgi:hypothetical protein
VRDRQRPYIGVAVNGIGRIVGSVGELLQGCAASHPTREIFFVSGIMNEYLLVMEEVTTVIFFRGRGYEIKFFLPGIICHRLK